MNCLREQEVTPPLAVRRVPGFKERCPAVLADAGRARQVGRAPIARLRSAPLAGRPGEPRKVLNEGGGVSRERVAIPAPRSSVLIDLPGKKGSDASKTFQRGHFFLPLPAARFPCL